MPILSDEEQRKSWEKRISFLERLMSKNGKYSLPPRLQNTGRGTTAERDIYFGTPPSTDPERVSLANRMVTWFNTDLGWEEGYYATTGKTGLVARGLVGAAASGWYPIGAGPMISMIPTAQFVSSAGAPVRGWGALGSGASRRIGGSAWFTYDDSTGRITMVKSGLYRVQAKSVIINGSGEFSSGLMIGPPSAAINTFDTKIALSSTLLSGYLATHESILANAGDVTYVQNFNGSVTYHMRANLANTYGGQFSVHYVGPPLVTD